MFHARQSFSCSSGFSVRSSQMSQRDDEERGRREQHQAVGDVPAAVLGERQHHEAEHLAGAEQLADERDREQHQAVAQAVADAVEEARPRRVLHRVALGAAHHDAVGDDEPDEHRQLERELVEVAFRTWSTTMTSEAMIDSCTMMRMEPGVWLRTRLTATLASVVTSMTPTPITNALSMRVVTASAEQMPSTCTPIGLLAMIGSRSALRSRGRSRGFGCAHVFAPARKRFRKRP